MLPTNKKLSENKSDVSFVELEKEKDSSSLKPPLASKITEDTSQKQTNDPNNRT